MNDKPSSEDVHNTYAILIVFLIVWFWWQMWGYDWFVHLF